MSNNIIEMPRILCEECKIREATRLCDYDIGYNIGVRIDIWTHFMRGCIIDYVH